MKKMNPPTIAFASSVHDMVPSVVALRGAHTQTVSWPVKYGEVVLAQVLLLVCDGVETASHPKVQVLLKVASSVHDMVPPVGAVRGKHLNNGGGGGEVVREGEVVEGKQQEGEGS